MPVHRGSRSLTPESHDEGVEVWLQDASRRRGGGDLSPDTISGLLRELTAQPGLAAHGRSLRPDPGGRAWRCLWRDDHVDVWLIAWDGGADTGWHDHDTSSGAFRVLQGAVVEERPRWSGRHEAREVASGHGMAFGPDHVHRLGSTGGRALTIHAYSPPLTRLGQYTLADDGLVRRRTISRDEELGSVAP